jgi:hypothetical protein
MSFTVDPRSLSPLFDWLNTVEEFGIPVNTKEMRKSLDHYIRSSFTSELSASSSLNLMERYWESMLDKVDMNDGSLYTIVGGIALKLLKQEQPVFPDCAAASVHPVAIPLSKCSSLQQEIIVFPTTVLIENEELLEEIKQTEQALSKLQKHQKDIPDKTLHSLRIYHTICYHNELLKLLRDRKGPLSCPIPLEKELSMSRLSLKEDIRSIPPQPMTIEKPHSTTPVYEIAGDNGSSTAQSTSTSFTVEPSSLQPLESWIERVEEFNLPIDTKLIKDDLQQYKKTSFTGHKQAKEELKKLRDSWTRMLNAVDMNDGTLYEIVGDISKTLLLASSGDCAASCVKDLLAEIDDAKFSLNEILDNQKTTSDIELNGIQYRRTRKFLDDLHKLLSARFQHGDILGEGCTT